MATLKRVGLQTPIVWLDVEPVPHFDWSADTQANAAVVRGAAKGYTDAGYAVGIYSTPYLWEGVVGNLALRAARVARGRTDLPRRGAATVPRRLGDPGRPGGARPVGRGRA